MIWTQEAMDKLAAMWAEGLEASAIGKHFGITKSAVLGKRNRMGLPTRGSPLNPPRKTKAPKPPPKVKCKPVKVVRKPKPRTDSEGCQWPIGDPLKPGFRFCGTPRASYLDGRRTPYCAVHYAAAYVNRLEIREARKR